MHYITFIIIHVLRFGASYLTVTVGVIYIVQSITHAISLAYIFLRVNIIALIIL